MTQPKHNPNPFIRMAQEAKEKKLAEMKGNVIKASDAPKKMSVPKAPKAPTFKPTRKTGRGG